MEQEVSETLEKGAIQKLVPTQVQFLSNEFLVEKKNRGNSPVINLNNLKKIMSHEYFKMEDLHCLKFLLEQDDFLCKIHLKKVYFSVALHRNSQKFVRFQWPFNLFGFLCLYFILRLAPAFFTKLIIVSITLLRQVNIGIITYLFSYLRI